MAGADALRRQEALDWVRRLHDPTFSNWDEHIEWLERSPANATAFDRALLDLEVATIGLAPSTPSAATSLDRAANDDAPAAPHSTRLRSLAVFGGGALAIGVAATVMLWNGAHPAGGVYAVRTAAGETRSLPLSDGTRIALNGDTEVRLDPALPRALEMVRGEALFTVVHDAGRPFTVRVGDVVVRDVGTVFDIVRTSDRTSIGVREGEITYDSAGANVRLAAGETMLANASGTAEVRHVDPASIGGWRRGRLTYTQAPMKDVADDLARATGSPFTVDPGVVRRRFTGTIALDGRRGTLARRVSAVTGLAVRPDGAGWRISLPNR